MKPVYVFILLYQKNNQLVWHQKPLHITALLFVPVNSLQLVLHFIAPNNLFDFLAEPQFFIKIAMSRLSLALAILVIGATFISVWRYLPATSTAPSKNTKWGCRRNDLSWPSVNAHISFTFDIFILFILFFVRLKILMDIQYKTRIPFIWSWTFYLI